ncbi:uncharacterized protein LY89DRAFT_658167 [Mollisia scopiformis]|uniref:RNase H type-1 domain-containing protein n=1 Tax=Mollisia scopiformis TaxID=149040 RepID=A0A132BBR0_MOLSC|nr:uncharacterized protein LY89DRAFT_658167 [Mollisia scopiformis]KUJ09087.1 hypothetical protein LY89DRAFT_658167 [Mollisia scopiformis]
MRALYERIRRLFHVATYGNQISHDLPLEIRRLRYDPYSIVLAISGICQSQDETRARASFSVFFAKNSFRIIAARLPAYRNQTSNTSQLYAVVAALQGVEEMLDSGHCISQAVLISDSRWLVDSLAVAVWQWEQNAWRNNRGRLMVNWELFRWLHGRISSLQARGCEVKFWTVRRRWNQEAIVLARSALR